MGSTPKPETRSSFSIAPQLVEHSGFVTAVGERVARFAAVRHTLYVHLRRLDRPSADRLQLVSDFTRARGSRNCSRVDRREHSVDITVVIALLRQLLPAVALYGRHNREAAIGTLAVERLIVTPQTRLVIAEHAFGPALEKLNLGRDRLWRELRIAMPPSAGLPRANQRGDANAIGVVALSLLLGRVLADDEYPVAVQALLEGVRYATASRRRCRRRFRTGCRARCSRRAPASRRRRSAAGVRIRAGQRSSVRDVVREVRRVGVDRRWPDRV